MQSIFRPLAALLVVSVGALAAEPTERHNGHDVAAREAIVKFKSVAPAAIAAIAQLADADQAVQLSKAQPLFKIRSRSKNIDALLNILQNRTDLIEYVEPNYIVRSSATPNDASFAQLWALSNIGQSILGSPGTAAADISAKAAWDVATGSAANVVAVIDTGVDYTHPDLAANMWSAPSSFTVLVNGVLIRCPAGSHGYNVVAQTCDPADDGYHGTHIAGTIGASGNNTIGVTGVNWTTRIMALKFLDSAGNGNTANAITAIDFAIQVRTYFGASANVRVMSASWNGGGYSQALADAITRANQADILFVAAAGNANANNDVTPTYPANFALPNIISVAATDNRDALATFSNYGAASVHIGAPGVNILSTMPGGSYGWASGTSMATPQVSGAAMLLLSKCALTTAALRNLLLTNTDLDAALAGKTTTGGRLNVNKAVRACAPPPIVTLNSATFMKTDLTAQGSWKSAYGVEGYSIANSGASLPTYVQMTAVGSTWTWASSTADVRALENSSQTDRIAATWFSASAVSFDLNFTDNNSHQVAVYALDWDSGNRSERVEVVDAATGSVLDSHDVTLFGNGVYLVWSLKGHVVIRATRTGGANAVVSGIFFGAGNPVVQPPPPSPGASASFLRVDSTTQGSWNGVYGRDGFEIVNSTRSYPAYAAVTPTGASTWTWSGSTTDARALQKPGAADRIASCWYGGTYRFDLNLSDAATHQVAVYLLDYDSPNRGERVDVLDAASGAVLDTRSVTSFNGGQYLVWNISGHVQIRVSVIAGANAVVSGIFFN